MNGHLWGGGLEGAEVKISPEVLEAYRELAESAKLEFDFYIDLDGVQHIRISKPLDLSVDEIWETYSREGEEFPLELLINDTGEFKGD